MVGNGTLLLPRLSAPYGVNILNIMQGFSSNIPIKVNGIWVRVKPSAQCWDVIPINLLCLTLCALFADEIQAFAASVRFIKHKGRVCAQHCFLEHWLQLQCDSLKQEGLREIPQLLSASCSLITNARNPAFGCKESTSVPQLHSDRVIFKQQLPLASKYFRPPYRPLQGYWKYVLSNFSVSLIFL